MGPPSCSPLSQAVQAGAELDGMLGAQARDAGVGQGYLRLVGALCGAVCPRLGCRRRRSSSDVLIWRCAGLFVTTEWAKAMPVSLSRWLQVPGGMGKSPSRSTRFGARFSVFADAKRHLWTRTTPSIGGGVVTPNLDACARFWASTSRGRHGLLDELSGSL